ncbi:MAG: glycosyltransferase family 4 protein [Bacteroidetes bacterium]|nr:glycosyltransferase family 4 protein [Bacteroidota bacterium]
MSKILLLTRYSNLGASSRYRCYQYLPYLRNIDWEITISPLLNDEYVKSLYSGEHFSFVSIIKSYLMRIKQYMQQNQYDLLWIQQEVFPWVPYVLESILMKSSIPYVVDYDDATFHRYDRHSSLLVKYVLGQKIDQVMHRASLVIAGNKYIADRAQKARSKRIEIIPTVVDLNRYQRVDELPRTDIFTIGWIGSPSTVQYLKDIHSSLRAFCQNKRVKVAVIGADNLKMDGVPIECKPWSEETEVEEIQKFNVGIMPLKDTPWEHGKCGFKLIQYMACARAAIGTPVGVNEEIITHGVDGFYARTPEEWINSLTILMNNKALCQQMGKMGRKKVEDKYCIQKTAPVLAKLLTELFEKEK